MLSPLDDTFDDAKNTLASHLVDRLREEILSGNLAPGSKINVESIRRNFGVSLSPLREALARLIAVGLVELHDNKGYSVAPTSLSNLGEITRLRQDDAKSLDAWERAHRQFHLTLIAGSNMPMLLNFCDVLHNLNDRYRRIFLVKRGGDRNVEAEHSEIAQAAVARDSAFACEKLREHIQRTGTNLKLILSNQIPA